LVALACLPAGAHGELTVTVGKEPRQKMTYGMDFERLWSWNGVSNKVRLAELALKECKVDYVRVAVTAAGEREEGKFTPEGYAQILDCMRTLKAARPDIQFFAIPQPIHVVVPGAPYTCFPLWISEHTPENKFVKFNPEKAAGYMVNYLRFIKEQGFKITFMDVKNECCKEIRPADAAIMVAKMREALGDEMPQMIAPSSFNYKAGTAWLREAKAGPGTDFFQIAATHNSNEKGSLEEFVKTAAECGKVAWNTELHNFKGPDVLAVSNSVILLSQIRAGVAGISEWLSLGNEKKEHKMFRAMDNGSLEVMRVYHIFKQLVNTSGGGHYLQTTVPEGLASSVAFLKDDRMTVWLLNNSHVPVAGVKVSLEGRKVVEGTATKLWWDADNGREGSRTEVVPVSPDSFVADVGAQTLVCYEFSVLAK
jgi:uncharacterized protein YbcV (DUF1398 family)